MPVLPSVLKERPQIDQAGKFIYPEDQLLLPWAVNPEASWIDYRVWVECELDAGMALHKPLPQRNPAADTLASVFVGDTDVGFSKGGVKLDSASLAVDRVQRMATSTYRFVLRGYGLRVGYTVPVPGLRSVGGVPAVPAERQWSSGNVLVGNLPGGIPVWACSWELHYYVTESPKRAAEPPAANPALHIRPDAQLPQQGVRLPRAPVEQRALDAEKAKPRPPVPQGRVTGAL